MSEETLVILKPDCMASGLCGKVISRFEAEGFEIVASNVTQLDRKILKEHYAHIVELPFFPEIEAYS